METYINNFNSFEKKIVYDFKLGNGGIGDALKFFMHILNGCIVNNERLYYKKNNLIIEKYIILKYPLMYIDQSIIDLDFNSWTFVHPGLYYNTFNTNYSIDIKDVFYFTDKVKINATYLFPQTVKDYVSIHLRLGDRFLETDQSFVLCTHDERQFSEENLYNLIEKNYNENIRTGAELFIPVELYNSMNFIDKFNQVKLKPNKSKSKSKSKIKIILLIILLIIGLLYLK